MSNTNTNTRPRRAGRRGRRPVAQVPGSGRTFAFRKVTRSDLSVSFKEVGNDVTCTITAAGPDRSVRLGTATVSCGADVEAAYKAAYVRALLDAESGVSV